MELLGPVDLIILSWECQGFSVAGFGEGLSDTRSSLFMDMVRLITWAQSISPSLSYVIENTPYELDQKESPRTLYVGQASPWRATLIQCGTMWFLCAPTL
jgi:site-specific DNA-cytosine methylase